MRRRCLRCGAAIPRGTYCVAHKPYGSGWGALRARVLARDEHICGCPGCPQCEVAHGGCGRTATTVDHINGVAQDNREANLRAMCRQCNTYKGGLP